MGGEGGEVEEAAIEGLAALVSVGSLQLIERPSLLRVFRPPNPYMRPHPRRTPTFRKYYDVQPWQAHPRGLHTLIIHHGAHIHNHHRLL